MFSKTRSALLTCAFTLLSLPTPPGSAQADVQPLSFAPLGTGLASDGDLHPLDGHRWLVARADGLFLVSSADEVRLQPAHLESLDGRGGLHIDGIDYRLLAAIDAEAGLVRLMLFDGDAVVEVRELSSGTATPEALCLYRNATTQDVALFVFDARGTLEQRYIYSRQGETLVDLPVRRDVGNPDVEACAVHDATGSLYVADGNLGVWRLDADEESDPVARPVMLARPWGSLDGDVEDITVDDHGGVWALLGDARRIEIARSGEQTSVVLPADLAAGALALSREGGAMRLAVFDEAARRPVVASVAPVVASVAARPPTLPDRAAAYLPPGLTASAETAPVRRYGDAADDPVVYGDARDPLIIGTDKREGLAVYSLEGEQRQFLSVGRVNNVDLVADAAFGDARRTIVAASNRTHTAISLFEIRDGAVHHLVDHPTGLGDVYGLCMYGSPTGTYVFINDTDGHYEQYRLTGDATTLAAQRVRRFSLPSQPEGCVVDTVTQRIYMGEEAAGIWVAGAEPDGVAPKRVIGTSAALVADVEGMDIYRSAEQALLVVSSQGSNSFAVYDLEEDHRLVGSFRVVADLARGIDGVSETDGLAVHARPLEGYPQGILVVQDGRNRMPDAPQNFKIIDWRDVAQLLDTGRIRP